MIIFMDYYTSSHTNQTRPVEKLAKEWDIMFGKNKESQPLKIKDKEPRFIHSSFGRFCYDIIKEKDGYTINLELPGFKRDDIEIDFDDEILFINAEKKPPENVDCLINGTGTFYGKINDKVYIPFSPETIKGDYENGILSIKLVKSKKDSPKIEF